MWASASVEGSVGLSPGRAVGLVLAGVKGTQVRFEWDKVLEHPGNLISEIVLVL